jgi:signal transduction histidine kinase/ligand-binding sensor domain-containing protein
MIRSAQSPFVRTAILLLALLGFIGPEPDAIAETSARAPIDDNARPPEPHISPQTIRLSVDEGDRPYFRRLSIVDGLSQSRVTPIAQDDRGFMWFGTQHGLNRFDGYDFKVYLPEAGNTNSVSCAYLFSLFKDRDGMLWMGCSQTLDRLDPRTETFTHYRIEGSGANALGGTVFHISQDHSGLLWLATGTGLYSLNPASGQVAHYRHSEDNPASLSSDDVFSSGEDREGALWVGTANGLDQFDPKTGLVTFHIPIPDSVSISFFEDHDKRFWIYHATGNGLALYDKAHNTVTPYSFYSEDTPPQAVSGVLGMIEDKQGNLWMATSSGIGLIEMETGRKRFIRYHYHPGDPHSIGSDRLNSVFKARDGNIWTGLDNGVNVFQQTTPQFQAFRAEENNPQSLSEGMVSALYDDASGTLWVGNGSGVDQVDRKTGMRVASIQCGLSNKPSVIAFVRDSHGTMWCGTFSDGLLEYDPVTKRHKHFRHDPADPTTISNDRVYQAFFAHNGILWIGTDDGLDRFEPATGTFHTYRVETSSRTSQRYIAIAEDSKGILWLGSYGSGLHRFDPRTGQFTVYSANPADARSLRDSMVSTVHVSGGDIVWAGTQNGLNKLDPSTGRFTAYDVKSGLPGNLIDCIQEDDRGNLWLSTNKGLSRFNLRTEAVANYTVIDGLPGNDLTGWSACAKNRRGELFFGGLAGAVVFAPDKLTESRYVPDLVLTDFQMAGVDARIGNGAILRNAISYTNAITIPHGKDTFFSVAFSGLPFMSPESVHYRYKLEGLDKDWYEVDGSARRASFTTLPAGNYTLRIQAKGFRGPWSEPGVTLGIDVLPAWWATWWVRLLYAVAVVFAIWWWHRTRMMQVSHQLLVRAEERINERTRIAQDLHDTLLQGLFSASMQLTIATQSLPNDMEAKSLVQRASEMLTLMIEESRNTVRGLRVHHLKRDSLESAIAAVPEDLGSGSNMRCNVVVEGTRRLLRPAIRDQLYWIARESISNALRHSHGTAVETVLEYSRARFRLIVRDDGAGIDPQMLRSNRSNHWGLVGIRERAQKIGGNITLSSAEGAGTEITLTIAKDLAYERNS